MAIGQRQRYRHLAIVLLAELTAILPRHADRMPSLLGKARVVDDPGRDRAVPLRICGSTISRTLANTRSSDQPPKPIKWQRAIGRRARASRQMLAFAATASIAGADLTASPTAPGGSSAIYGVQQKSACISRPRACEFTVPHSVHGRLRVSISELATIHPSTTVPPRCSRDLPFPSVTDSAAPPMRPERQVRSRRPHAGRESPPSCDSPPHCPRLCDSVKLGPCL